MIGDRIGEIGIIELGRRELLTGMELGRLFEAVAATGKNLNKKSGFLAEIKYKKFEGICNEGNDGHELCGSCLRSL